MQDMSQDLTQPWFLQLSADFDNGKLKVASSQKDYDASYYYEASQEYYYWEIGDGDKDINFFIGLDKELNRSFSLLLEYDSALNDNDYEINELSFGKGKGYLNAGIRWTIVENLLIELNLNNFNKNSEAEHITRQIKIIYSDRF